MSEHDPLDSAQREKVEKDRRHRAKIERQNEGDDIKWLCGNKRGRRFLWKLLESAGVFRLSFDKDAMLMSFREGERNYGLRVLAMIHKVAPDSYATMLRESSEPGESKE